MTNGNKVKEARKVFLEAAKPYLNILHEATRKLVPSRATPLRENPLMIEKVLEALVKPGAVDDPFFDPFGWRTFVTPEGKLVVRFSSAEVVGARVYVDVAPEEENLPTMLRFSIVYDEKAGDWLEEFGWAFVWLAPEGESPNYRLLRADFSEMPGQVVLPEALYEVFLKERWSDL